MEQSGRMTQSGHKCVALECGHLVSVGSWYEYRSLDNIIVTPTKLTGSFKQHCGNPDNNHSIFHTVIVPPMTLTHHLTIITIPTTLTHHLTIITIPSILARSLRQHPDILNNKQLMIHTIIKIPTMIALKSVILIPTIQDRSTTIALKSIILIYTIQELSSPNVLNRVSLHRYDDHQKDHPVRL